MSWSRWQKLKKRFQKTGARLKLTIKSLQSCESDLLLRPLQWRWAEEGVHRRYLAADWEPSSLKNWSQTAGRSPRVRTPEVEAPPRHRRFRGRRSHRLQPQILLCQAERRGPIIAELFSFWLHAYFNCALLANQTSRQRTNNLKPSCLH